MKTLWFTGLSGAGKTTLANIICKDLNNIGENTYILDGDNVRLGLNSDLGFSEEDRHENIRRLAEVSKLMNNAGINVIVACISPYEADRMAAKKIIGEKNFVEIYVCTSFEECERRDVKGLYKKARNGEIKCFTGISSDFEKPVHADIVIDTENQSPEETARNIYNQLKDKYTW